MLIKQFISHALTAHAKEVLEKVMPKGEVNFPREYEIQYNFGYADGYVACLNQLKSNAKEIGINLE